MFDPTTIVQGAAILVLAGLGKVVYAAGSVIHKTSVNVARVEQRLDDHINDARAHRPPGD
jgi:hypothetical protein